MGYCTCLPEHGGRPSPGLNAMDAIVAFANHVVKTGFENLPSVAIRAAKTFILDTLGVGLAGSSGPMAVGLSETAETWGNRGDAHVWGSGGKHLPAPAAAMCNAYQAHNSEFDCVHEGAVVHAMTAVLPVAFAGAQRMTRVKGRDLITAVTLGVDVAAGLGVAATTGLRFFRPATAGAFGATAALGKLIGLNDLAMINAFSIVYGQCCGTMQAHSEGSMLLAMQMGFNARNAVVACDLAARGFDAPKNVLEGPFGYFKLIETRGEPMRVAKDLGKRWFVTELAHKPFPSGRATHGIIEACLELRRQHGIKAEMIDRITVQVPPLVNHLVGRPPLEKMSINYARLCARYLAARALLVGGVGFDDFTAQAYGDARTQRLAQRVTIEVRDTGDPNALTPVEVEIALTDGGRLTIGLDTVLGNPTKPLSQREHLQKFERNCMAAAHPMERQMVERLIEMVDKLDEVTNIAELLAA
jgi:aconitate decarboxylase